MFKFSAYSIAAATNGVTKNIKSTDLLVDSLVIDNRDVIKNSVFVAIKGPNFDGHSFCFNAIERGASFVIVEKEIENIPQIIVKNTRKALLDIATLNRSRFKGEITAITGSVGKTTTKDMLGSILNSCFKTLKTFKNLNNEIGLPKTILKLDESYKAAVLELGMSNFGEIRTLSKVCSPSIAIITKIGVSHIEFLKTKENILKAKLEILDGMEKDTHLILNGDDELLKNLHISDHKIILCGIENSMNIYSAKNIKQIDLSTEYDLYLKEKFLAKITLPTIGKHNVLNSLLAIAAAGFYSIPIENIVSSLKEFTPSDMRQNICNINGIIVIEDFYNASPDSMKASIETLTKIPSSGRKIAVLGSMLELGDFSKKEHQTIGEFAVRNNIDILYCYGEETKEMVDAAKKEADAEKRECKINYFTERKNLIDCLKKELKKTDVVLFKASLRMNFKEIFSSVFPS